MKKNSHDHQKKHTIRQLLSAIGRQKLLFLVALTCLGLAVACETGGFLLLRYTIDNAIIKKNTDWPLYLFALLFLVIALVRSMFSFFAGRGSAYTAESVVRRMRNDLFDHMQRLSFTYHTETNTGELLQRATSDIDAIRRFYADQVPEITRIICAFAINFTAVYLLEWRLALTAIIILPALAWLSYIFFKKIYTSYDAYQDQEATMSSMVQENLNCIRIVRAFARQDWEIDKFDQINVEQFKRGRKLLFQHALYWPVSHFLCGAQSLLVIGIGAFMTYEKSISPGTYIAFTAMVASIIWPLQEFGRIIIELSKSYVSFIRVSQIFNEEQENMNEADSGSIKKLKGKIEYRNVTFSYAENVPVLKDISFTCQKGEKIAFIGETGSGKSSIINLLLRFYEYDNGEILIDNKPITSLPKHMLRAQIGLVEQEPFLFSTTIKENITYGMHSPVSDQEVIKAARAAGIHESIMKFPLGYDTLVGEKGVTLSGGQKQRIALARIVIKNPAVLVLDDATSAVDAETEEEIHRALQRIMQNRTTLIIAHRIQTLKEADMILVMQDGHVVQKGTHDSLIKEPGFYQNVCALQEDINNLSQENLSKELYNEYR